MIISDAIDILKDTELKQLNMKDDRAAILGHLNIGITELYKRFHLWKGEVEFPILDGVTEYALDGVDANVGLDLTDHDLIIIKGIFVKANDRYTRDKELIINAEGNDQSVYTPQYNQIKLLTPEENVTPYLVGDTLKVYYKGAPIFLTHEKANIPLPPQFIEALFNYVGYRAHGSMRTSTDNRDNNTYYQRFERSCALIEMEGMYTQNGMESTKFEDRGFV